MFRADGLGDTSSSSSDSDDSDCGGIRSLFAGLGGVGDIDSDDELDEMGALVIDESPCALRSGAAVDVNANVASGVVDTDVGGEKQGRMMTRSRHRAISVSAEVTLEVSAGPPSKRSRSSSRARVSTRSRTSSRTSSRSRVRRSCSPLTLPSPPSPKPTRELEDASRAEYLKKVELQSKSWLKEHSDHKCFGQKKTSLRPVNCVARGGLSMSALAR